MFGHPVRITQKTIYLLVCQIGNHVAYIAELIAVFGIDNRIERAGGVDSLSFLKEGVEAVPGYHQEIIRGFKDVGRILDAAVDALEGHSYREQGVVGVSGLNLVDGECHLGENACRRLQVCAVVLADQRLQRFFVVDDSGGLKNLGRRRHTDIAIDHGVFIILIMVEDTHVDLLQVSHHAKTIVHLEIESRTERMDEAIGVLEILRMLIVVAQDIGAIIWIVLAVLVLIGAIHHDTCQIIIAGKRPDAVGIGQV